MISASGPRLARKRAGLAFLLLLLLFAGALVFLDLRGEDPVSAGQQAVPATPALPAAQPSPATQAQVERGRYLAAAGNCAGCHTDRSGAAYAGGAGIATPFGTVFPGNLTPDPATGLGQWTSDHFWRALHDGRSRDGRLLYPAFPYPSFTHVTRADSDAIFAYLQSLAPVARANRAHELRFPYDSQLALAAWRALFFSPGGHVEDPAETAQWNRGAYLVKGLGHCADCHAPRNALGATVHDEGLSGGLIPMQDWYAPSLTSAHEAGVADWEIEHIVELLGTGVSPRGSVIGPMADVVYDSTQHLADADLQAIAVYLKSMPQTLDRPARARIERNPEVMARGAAVYDEHCAQCHGTSGEGASVQTDATSGAAARVVYPPLAGNRAVTLDSPINLIRIVRSGGFLPATSGNPRPYGMPPFSHVLDGRDVADVLTFIRGAWGNDAAPVVPQQLLQH